VLTYQHLVQGVKQQEAAAYVVRLNQRIQALQQQQVSREHRAALREQRNFILAIICAIIYPYRDRNPALRATPFAKSSE
jgi:hypothetical protein